MSFLDNVKFTEFKGSPSFNDLFPTREEKIAIATQVVLGWAFTIGSYRSAHKRDWGAACWKTLVAYGASREIARQVDRRAERFVGAEQKSTYLSKGSPDWDKLTR